LSVSSNGFVKCFFAIPGLECSTSDYQTAESHSDLSNDGLAGRMEADDLIPDFDDDQVPILLIASGRKVLDKLKKLLNQRQIFEFNNYVKCFIKNYVI
jgi:hypothetical protein